MRARTDTTTGMRSAVTLAIAASTLLGIAGCSTAAPSTTDGEGVPTETEQSPEFDGAVYDFTQINGIEPASTIRFVIPEEILELESYYAENRVLRSVTAESVDLGSAKFCGIELTYEYASDEVVDRIAATPMDVGGGGGGGLLAETPEKKMTFGLGITGYGFAPLRLPEHLDFPAMFHGVDERVPLDALGFGKQVLTDLLLDY